MMSRTPRLLSTRACGLCVAVLGLFLLQVACGAAQQSAIPPLGRGGTTAPPAPPLVQQAAGQVAVNAAIHAKLQEVGEQVAGLVVKVDKSTNNYDAWTLRLHALAPWLLAVPLVCYVLPKLGWRLVELLVKRVRTNGGKPNA